MQVRYAELKGEEARARLLAFLHTLPGQPGFLGAELLSSPEQPGLYLIASRWADGAPPLDAPPGARAWGFVVEASVP